VPCSRQSPNGAALRRPACQRWDYHRGRKSSPVRAAFCHTWKPLTQCRPCRAYLHIPPHIPSVDTLGYVMPPLWGLTVNPNRKHLRRQCEALSVEMKRNNGAVAIVITILRVFQDHLSFFQYWLYLLYINKLRWKQVPFTLTFTLSQMQSLWKRMKNWRNDALFAYKKDASGNEMAHHVVEDERNGGRFCFHHKQLSIRGKEREWKVKARKTNYVWGKRTSQLSRPQAKTERTAARPTVLTFPS